MPKRFLFRGKRFDNNEWVEGYYLDGSNKKADWALICPKMDINMQNEDNRGLSCGRFYFVDPQTIGQCTGLRDRRSKLIFEGDILSFSNHRSVEEIYRVEVVWEDYGHWAYRLDVHGEYNELYHRRECYEIIGNIHDNPELLESGGQ